MGSHCWVRWGIYGPLAGALDAESPKGISYFFSGRMFGHEIGVFLTDLHHMVEYFKRSSLILSLCG